MELFFRILKTLPGFIIANITLVSFLLILIRLKKLYSAITVLLILSIGWWAHYCD